MVREGNMTSIMKNNNLMYHLLAVSSSRKLCTSSILPRMLSAVKFMAIWLKLNSSGMTFETIPSILAGITDPIWSMVASGTYCFKLAGIMCFNLLINSFLSSTGSFCSCSCSTCSLCSSFPPSCDCDSS